MENKQLYEIRLEDYSLPRYASASKAYYGTWRDILAFTDRLRKSEDTSVRYCEIIDAVASYDKDNIPNHTVAGNTYPILVPVKEVCRFETRLTNPVWDFKAHYGSIYPCQAKAASVCQSLIRTNDGYERCLKARILGLQICFQRLGWSIPEDIAFGFPGIVSWENKIHSLNLFVSQQHYDWDELALATADVADISRIDLGVMVADILGEG